MFTASFFLGCRQHGLFQGETKHPRSICFDKHNVFSFSHNFKGSRKWDPRLTGLTCAFSRSHQLQFMQPLYDNYCVFFQLKHQLRAAQHGRRKLSLFPVSKQAEPFIYRVTCLGINQRVLRGEIPHRPHLEEAFPPWLKATMLSTAITEPFPGLTSHKRNLARG